MIFTSRQTKASIFKQHPIFKLYLSFTTHIVVEIYKNKYGVVSTDSIKENNIMDKLKHHEPELYHDFFNDEAIIEVMSLQILIEKVGDGDIVNSVGLVAFNFLHPLNQKLSIQALAASFLNYKLLHTKITDRSLVYNKDNLPKITLLSMVGYYSELDIDILYHYSKNVQIVMLYDSRTGGPDFSNWEIVETDTRLPNCTKPFYMISDKLLLLPIDVSHGSLESHEIYDIFEKVICYSVQLFKPDIALVNHSFNFHPSSSSEVNPIPFSLKARTLCKIIYDFCQAVQYRILVTVRKPIRRVGADGKPLWHSKSTEKSTELKEVVGIDPTIYFREWDYNYCEDAIESVIEVITSNTILSAFQRITLFGRVEGVPWQ